MMIMSFASLKQFLAVTAKMLRNTKRKTWFASVTFAKTMTAANMSDKCKAANCSKKQELFNLFSNEKRGHLAVITNRPLLICLTLVRHQLAVENNLTLQQKTIIPIKQLH